MIPSLPLLHLLNREKPLGIRRIHKLLKPQHFLSIICKLEKKRVFIRILSLFRICRAARMYHASMRLGVVDFLKHGDLLY
jgi:hypothetical protein